MNAMPPTTDPTSLPVTVAFFSANPPSLTPLDLEGERLAIESALAAVGLHDVIEIRNHPGSTPDDLQKVLLQRRPTIVQFSGHGQTTHPSGLMMHGQSPHQPTAVSGEALGHLLARVGRDVRLVVLNACYSAEQAAAIGAHVDFVIGMHDPIGDQAARVFAVALYRALAFGNPIQSAFDLGVNALMLEGLSLDVDIPRLHVREGADPTATALAPAPKGEDAPRWDVFLCYARVDRPYVQPLAAALEQRQLRVFFYERTPGEVRSRRLEQALDASDHGIVVASPTSMEDPWVREQYPVLLDNAVMDDHLLIPVLVGEGELRMPPFLRIRQPADLRGKTDGEWDAEIDAIVRALRRHRAARG